MKVGISTLEFAQGIALTLAALKLDGTIALPWIWVASPIWLTLVLTGIVWIVLV